MGSNLTFQSTLLLREALIYLPFFSFLLIFQFNEKGNISVSELLIFFYITASDQYSDSRRQVLPLGAKVNSHSILREDRATCEKIKCLCQYLRGNLFSSSKNPHKVRAFLVSPCVRLLSFNLCCSVSKNAKLMYDFISQHKIHQHGFSFLLLMSGTLSMALKRSFQTVDLSRLTLHNSLSLCSMDTGLLSFLASQHVLPLVSLIPSHLSASVSTRSFSRQSSQIFPAWIRFLYLVSEAWPQTFPSKHTSQMYKNSHDFVINGCIFPKITSVTRPRNTWFQFSDLAPATTILPCKDSVFIEQMTEG